MHCKFYPFLYSVLKYQKSLLTFLPIFTTAASNSIFHGAARLIFPSFLLSLSPFFFSYFCLIFSLILLSFFIKCIRNLITSLVENSSITSYGLKNNIPNLWQALESFDFISSFTAHCTPATLVFFL